MKNKKILSGIIFTIFLLNIFILPTQAITKSSLVNNIDNRILSIKENFLAREIISSGKDEIIGIGINDNAQINSSREGAAFLLENLITCAALAKDYNVRDSGDSLEWLQGKIYPLILTLDEGAGFLHYDGANSLPIYLVNQLLFIEFISETFEYTDNPDMFRQLERVYRSIGNFEAEYNETLNNVAHSGAYWAAMQGGKKFHVSASRMHSYPLTNISLLVAASSAHFARIYQSRLSEEDPQYFLIEEAILRAKDALSYAENYVWNPKLQLFNEDQSLTWQRYYVDTQIYALLAYSHLYSITGEQIYLTKADLLINSIIKNFWDAGNGGIFNSLSGLYEEINAEKIKHGFDNAFFAYTLSQLAKATDVNDDSFSFFLKFERQNNKYMNLAENVLVFMENNLYDLIRTEDGDTKWESYTEWVTAAGSITSVDPVHSNKTRLISTNAYALYALNAIKLANLPFAQFFQTYIIIISVTVGVIFMIMIILSQRKKAGEDLSKTVKDLLSGED